MRTLAVIVCVSAFLLSPQVAHADPLPSGAVVSFNVNLITVTASAGRANDLVVTRDATGFWISETGPLSLSPGAGCGHVSGYPATTVRCPLTAVRLRVDLGDWDDELTVVANIQTDVSGGAGNDVINGGPSQDMIDGGFGADVMRGGGGLDTVTYQSRTAAVRASNDGVAGDDGQTGERDTIAADVENLWGGSGADQLIGNSGANWIYGLGGSDRLHGGGGNDRLDGGDGNDIIDGGAGADELIGANGTDTADYSARTAGVSVALDGYADDGEAGEGDFVSVNTENVTGGSGADSLVGSSVRNVLRGGPGDDVLLGNGGDDALLGEAGDDWLFGGAGNDWLPGDTGTAVGRDHIDGGTGSDATGYEGRATTVWVILDGVANDGQSGEGDQLVGVESVTGGSGPDIMIGGPGADTLSGGGGNDYLDGAGGSDTLRGSLGDDTIYGLDGNDILDGGAGVDDLDGEADFDGCEPPDGGVRAGCESWL